MSALIDLQLACESDVAIPSASDFQSWCDMVLSHQGLPDKELTIRLVDNDESQALNREYRDKDKPTNVLSFPFEAPAHITLDLLGDLVICVPVMAREAEEQNKNVMHHWAHLVIHGCLHLLGYDHINDDEANAMETIEIAILAKLSIDDPYRDH